MQDYRDVIIAPVITEKSMKLMADNNQYTFKVAKNTNKIEVRQAVESLFGVKVTNANILNVKQKNIKRGRFTGKVPGYKKAIVTLAEGDTIQLFNEE